MYLLYLDDAGSAGNPNETHLVLGGFAVFERQAYWIAHELDKLASNIVSESPNRVEFHASAIFGGREYPWKTIRDKPARCRVIRNVLDVLARTHESTVAFACVVHKPSFSNEDPMRLAFEEICQRFELFLKGLYRKNDPQRGVIILDESAHETSLQDLAHDFRSLGTRWGVIHNLAEIPLFVDSRASRLVQLADHVAYAAFRRFEAGDTSYLDPILAKFHEENGRLHGLVHKQNVDFRCMCPACLSRRLTGPSRFTRNSGGAASSQ